MNNCIRDRVCTEIKRVMDREFLGSQIAYTSSRGGEFRVRLSESIRGTSAEEVIAKVSDLLDTVLNTGAQLLWLGPLSAPRIARALGNCSIGRGSAVICWDRGWYGSGSVAVPFKIGDNCKVNMYEAYHDRCRACYPTVVGDNSYVAIGYRAAASFGKNCVAYMSGQQITSNVDSILIEDDAVISTCPSTYSADVTRIEVGAGSVLHLEGVTCRDIHIGKHAYAYLKSIYGTGNIKCADYSRVVLHNTHIREITTEPGYGIYAEGAIANNRWNTDALLSARTIRRTA